jgi:hypothetical protein
MFNSGDAVQEIATSRVGKISLSGRVGAPPERFTVQFIDGKQPIIKDFVDPNELKLVHPIVESGAPRLIPETPVL